MDVASGVMLVTNKLEKSPAGGRELLCKLNHDALKELFGERLLVVEVPRRPLQGAKEIASAFRGYIDGLNGEVIAEALRLVRSGRVGRVFVEGSNLGEVVSALKTTFPSVEVCTFFHNVEAKFFLGALKQSKTARAVAVLAVNCLAERKAVRFSDKRICLSERDSRLLRRLYGRAATHVSPMALEDKMPPGPRSPPFPGGNDFALFVGGFFYANQAGISWFVEHVVPRIGIKVRIVGRGFERVREELERKGRVEVIGAVDDLSEWYLNARFVITPIFDGSGMKTKVAEALMYGKKIIGTPEAFSGYEDVAAQAGWVCTTADEFVAAISEAQQLAVKSFDPELRAIYEEKYSLPAARERLARILE